MAFQIKTMRVDLKADLARVDLTDADTAAHVTVHLPIPIPDNMTADEMEQMARVAVKQVLQAAISEL